MIFTFYKKKYQNSEISFVLKSDAYGVGCIEVSNFLIKNNFKSFFVGTVYEALNIKKNSNIANLDIYILYESIILYTVLPLCEGRICKE